MSSLRSVDVIPLRETGAEFGVANCKIIVRNMNFPNFPAYYLLKIFHPFFRSIMSSSSVSRAMAM
jgi:hypothetical protein